MTHRLLSLLLVLLVSGCAHNGVSPSPKPSLLNASLDLIESEYIDAVPRAEIEARAVSALIDKMDPYGHYYDAKEWGEFEQSFAGEFFGIGAMLEADEVQELPRVKALLVHSNARRAGLRRGDLLKAIDDVPMAGVEMHDVVGHLIGSAGTSVRLMILREGIADPLELTIERGRVPRPSVRGIRWSATGEADYLLDEHGDLGYVRINAFGDDTVALLQDALTRLEARGTRGLVLDLRDCIGGKLSRAIQSADFFLDAGTIVTTVERDTSKTNSATPGMLFSGAILMLINDGTVSSAEVFAGALVDNARVRVMGQRSFGKGRVQRMFPLREGQGGIKISTGTFQRPSGKTIDRHDAKRPEDAGIAPDPGLEFALDAKEREAWLAAVDPLEAMVEPHADDPPIVDRVLDRAIELLRAEHATR